MRDLNVINERFEQETQPHNRVILYGALQQNVGTVDQMASTLSEAYVQAFLNALSHRPNVVLVDQFATLAWLVGSDLNVAEIPFMQYGMPRIRRLAIELKLPWIPTGNLATHKKAARMANGLPCEDRCFTCFRGR